MKGKYVPHGLVLHGTCASLCVRPWHEESRRTFTAPRASTGWSWDNCFSLTDVQLGGEPGVLLVQGEGYWGSEKATPQRGLARGTRFARSAQAVVLSRSAARERLGFRSLHFARRDGTQLQNHSRDDNLV